MGDEGVNDSHLRFQDLAASHVGDPVFNELAFEVRAGERIGLVGPNGAGKTTLDPAPGRLEQPDYGQLFVRPGIRVSLLRQETSFEPGETLIEVVKSGLASLIDLQHELEEAAQEMAEAEDAADRERAERRYDELHRQIEHQDAYSIDHRVEEVLTGLGFSEAEFHRPAATFSGGQQSRMMLAKLLLESPDLMLLDEPSNHLDIATTEWLESYLARQPVAMVVVSHDRYFLDKVVEQDLGAAPGPDHRLPRQLQPVLAAADREGQGARAPVRAAGRKGREARSLHPQVRSRPAPSRPTTASASSSGWSATGSKPCATSSGRSCDSTRSNAPAISWSKPASCPRPLMSPCSAT